MVSCDPMDVKLGLCVCVMCTAYPQYTMATLYLARLAAAIIGAVAPVTHALLLLYCLVDSAVSIRLQYCNNADVRLFFSP